MRGCVEASPDGGRQRAADTHPADADGGEIDHGSGARDHDINRLGPDRRNDAGDVGQCAHAGRIEAVGACFGIGNQPADRILEIRLADGIAFRTPDQQDIRTGAIDGAPRGPHPLHRDRQGTESPAVTVFDRQACDPGLDRHQDVFVDAVGMLGIAGLEISVDRQIGRGAQRPNMVECFVGGRLAAVARLRPGVACARRAKRLEAELFQLSRARDVPGVRQDEAPILMQDAEAGPLLGMINRQLAPSRRDRRGFREPLSRGANE